MFYCRYKRITIQEMNKYVEISSKETEEEVFKSGGIMKKLYLNEALSKLASEYTPNMFDILQSIKLGKGGEIQITDPFLIQTEKREDGLGYYNEAKRFNCQRIDGFKAANYFYKKFI